MWSTDQHDDATQKRDLTVSSYADCRDDGIYSFLPLDLLSMKDDVNQFQKNFERNVPKNIQALEVV